MKHENPDVDAALHYAAECMEVSLAGKAKYGWNRKSAGTRVKTKGNQTSWLRVQFTGKEKINERIWDGEIAAANIEGISKPDVQEYFDWEDERTKWRATLMSYVPHPLCSSSPVLPQTPPYRKINGFVHSGNH